MINKQVIITYNYNLNIYFFPAAYKSNISYIHIPKAAAISLASFNGGVSSPSSIKLIYCIVILIFPISSACVICFIFLTSLILLLTLLDFYNSIYLHHKLFAIFWQVYIVKTYKTYTLPRYTYLHPLLSVHLCSSAFFQVSDNLVQNFSGLILFPMWESYQLCTKSVFDISRKKRHRIKFGAVDIVIKFCYFLL